MKTILMPREGVLFQKTIVTDWITSLTMDL